MISSFARRIARAHRVLAQIPSGTRAHHQKRRRLHALQHRLAAVRADEAAGRVRVCFGSRQLFRRQFALTANGYTSHEVWRLDWRAARGSQFFVVGSKDETAGCQGCVATVAGDGTLTVRLRLPNALATHGKYVVVAGVRFRHGHEAVVAAIGRNLSSTRTDHEAMCWRFVRDRKGWRVLATVSVPAGERVSREGTGAVAVDLNADHLALTDLDRFGNPLASLRIPCVTGGRARAQRAAAIGDAVKAVVAYARQRATPIIIERLDFAAKKDALEQRGSQYARTLSGFAYSAFHALLRARAYDAGITIQTVNPAYTSVIGAFTVAERYGLSRHQAAACSIGRRGLQLAERPPRRLGDQVTFPLPARNRGKHVWAFWREVSRRAAAHAARGRPGDTARSSPAPALDSSRDTARRVIRSSAAGGTPARESSAALFG